MNAPQFIPLVAAAQLLLRSYQATRDAVLRGEIRGHRDESGHWVCELAHVKELQADRRKTAKRA